jgi:branched-chain amino acid transport system ATP-binding protein
MARMDRVTLLSARGLTRAFGGLTAVDRVDLDLPTGEIRAIIGPNGAGKTTLVGLICGRILPTAGRITFKGNDITDVPAHRRVRLGIAYTFQVTSIYGNLSVASNVSLAAQSAEYGGRGVRGGAGVRRVALLTETALEQVGLADRRNVPARELPYGHQRMLEVAMGLALDPKLLILDEPTQGLSDAEIERFCGLKQTIASRTTMLLIEHNMAVVMRLAHRITVMERGRILAEGEPSVIRADPAVQAAYLGA